MNKRKVGSDKEGIAAEYLKTKGVTVLESNFRCRQGEIDLICEDGEYLIFVEVKYRRNNDTGAPEEAVGYAKQKKICRVSDYYRLIHHLADDTAIRFDVIAIEGEKIRWIPDAFSYQ